MHLSMANPNGTPKNLVPAHPGNANAEKGGAHSPRRRAEQEAAVLESLKADPAGYLKQDLIERFAQLRGYSNLLVADLTKKGVSDSSGDLRRVASQYLKTWSIVEEAAARLEETMSSDEVETTSPDIPSKSQLLTRLWEMARDPTKASSSSVTAAIYLHRQGQIADTDRSFSPELANYSDEEIERQIEAWCREVTTAPGNKEGTRRAETAAPEE